MYKQTLTSEQAIQKLRHYCSYQERCHSEVRDKLYELGVRRNDHDSILAGLIETGHLNEERFAIAYAGGRFRIKHWGRIKIRHELRQKQVSDYSIKKALKQIDEDEYIVLLKELALQKFNKLPGGQAMVRKKKTIDHMLRQGFELDLVRSAVAAI